MSAVQCSVQQGLSSRQAGSSGSSTLRGCRRLPPMASNRSSISASRCSSDDGGSTALARRELLGAAAALGALLSLQPAASAEATLPKAYEDTAVKLVKALREAISTDLSDAEEREVRRAADPAKNLVRQFLTRWKDDAAVQGEESYRQLTSAIQQLGAFYMANGQRARLSSAVGQQLLDTLDAAEAALPQRDDKPSLLPFF